MTLLTDNNAPNNADNQTMTTWTYAWAAGSARQTVVEKLYIDNVQMDNITTCTDNGTLRTSLQYPNGRTLAYAYDAVNRLSTIAGGGSTLAEYDYKGYYLDVRKLNGDVLRQTFTATSDLDGYDAFGRAVTIHHQKVSGGIDVVKLNYGYDYASNPLYIEDCVTSTNSELYAYDAAHRLADMKRGALNTQKNGITSPTFGQTWTLDKLGNWRNLADNGTPDVRQHNEVNEISLPSGGHGYPRTYGGSAREITHDAAGNVATCQSNDGTTTWRYTYDYRNQLIKAESKTTGQYVQVVTYLYDGQNKRVKKHLQTGPDVVYIYDGWRCIEEREYISNAWKAKRQYVFGGLYLDEELLFDKDTNNDGNCTDSGGSTRYMYCQNNNYNVVALTDSTGAVVERVSYSAYGQPTCTRVSDGHTQTASHFDNPWLFQGQRYCPESGLYYSNERYYSPALGRFIQPDLTDYPDGMNRFECMRSNTLNGVDPYGLQKIELKVKEDESDHGSANLWEMLNYGAKRRWGSTPKVSGNVANLNVWSIAQGIGTCSSNSNFVQAKVAGSGEGTVTLKVTVQYALLAQVSVPGNYGGSAVAQVHVFGLNGGTLDHAETPPTMSQSQPFRMSNVVTGVLNGEIKGFPCDGKFRTIASATDDATINPTGPAVAGDSELRAVARKAVVRGQAKAVVSVTLE